MPDTQLITSHKWIGYDPLKAVSTRSDFGLPEGKVVHISSFTESV